MNLVRIRGHERIGGMVEQVTAGIYTRLSLDRTGAGLAVQRQETACRDLATRHGWTVAEVYEDNDVSASTGKERPEYQRLLADLESGSINAVVVYAWDRLARRMTDLVAFIEMQRRVNFDVAHVTGDVDLSTASGRQTAYILGSVAQGEAERLGERVSAQKAQRAMLGIPHKGRHRLYGYDENWAPVEAETAIIKEAFQRRAAGESTTAIARDFTTRGIKTVSGRDWSSGVLGQTLTKHVYAGKVTFKGEVVADSIHPALVDVDTFNAAQRNLSNDSAGTNARRYLLSGILRCEHCLSPMKGNPSNQMYRCSTTYGGCGRLSVRIALADKAVTWAAMQRANMKPKRQPSTRDYDAEIASAEAERAKVQADYRAGIYTLAEAKALIDAERTKVREAAQAKARAVPRNNYASQKYLDFGRMNLSQKRAFISSHITDVIVGPAVSRGHQTFDPARFECHYPDGTSERLERPVDDPVDDA